MIARGKILVAMSGGVDSSVAAWLLRDSGYEVIGATLLLHPGATEPDPALSRLCADLEIPLHALRAEREFSERVILPAAREYDSGRTPNPCCECNELLKFALLGDLARELGAAALATGHYCVSAGDRLLRGRDRAKDQSYFLYRLKRELLPFLRFPLGELTKPEVRKLAAENRLVTAGRPESQDTCFAVAGECCGDTLLRRAGIPPKPGKVVFSGRTVGRHSGIHRCTIGQRGGLGVALGVPAYVKRIDGTSGEVELCTERKELAVSRFFLERTNWHREPRPDETPEVQIRYRSRPVPCRVRRDGPRWIVETPEPLFAVTPGQAGVIYDRDELLGGGVISLA